MGLEAREAATAIGAQAFAATSPANSASAGAMDRAEQCQCSGWAHSCLRPVAWPRPPVLCAHAVRRGPAAVWGDVTLAPRPPPRPEGEMKVS